MNWHKIRWYAAGLAGAITCFVVTFVIAACVWPLLAFATTRVWLQERGTYDDDRV